MVFFRRVYIWKNMPTFSHTKAKSTKILNRYSNIHPGTTANMAKRVRMVAQSLSWPLKWVSWIQVGTDKKVWGGRGLMSWTVSKS